MECAPQEARTGEDNLLVTLFEGVQMTETIMLKVFAKHGIERVRVAARGTPSSCTFA